MRLYSPNAEAGVTTDPNLDDDDGGLVPPIEDAPAEPEPVAEAEPAAEPVVEAEPDIAPEPEPQSFSISDLVGELGFENVESDEDARQRLIDGWQQQRQQYEEMQARLNEVRPLVDYGRQYLSQLQQPQQQEQPASQESEGWWSPPPFDQRWVEKYREVVTDPDGSQRVTWSADTPAEVRANAEAYQQYVDDWAHKLIHRPHEVLPEIMEKEFDRLFEDRYTRRAEERDSMEYFQQVEEANSEWMYAKDPVTGRVARDPATGRNVLTAEGQHALDLLDRAEQIGIARPQDQWQYVVDQISLMRSQRGANQDTRAQADAQRQSHLKRAAAPVSRNGSIPPVEGGADAIGQNSNLSPGQQLLAQLRNDGQI